MIAAGAEQICMIISPEKSDIIRYYAERDYAAEFFYVVQKKAGGLCDALFRAEPFARHHGEVLIGLPDTIWFPENAYHAAKVDEAAGVNLVMFPVLDPTAFDSVVCDDVGFVRRVDVKKKDAVSHWIWGAVTATGKAFHDLKLLWQARHREDEYLGDLLNAYIAAGNVVRGSYSGETYMDVGTLAGYHAAQDFLRSMATRNPSTDEDSRNDAPRAA
jgi:dTDP-glucose pyrophosphorylase